MRRISKSFFCSQKLFLLLFFLITTFSFAEDVKITTYYPSPYGSYKQISIEDGGTEVDKYGSLQIIRELNNHLGSHVAFIRNGSTRMGLGYKQSSDTFGFGPGVTVASATPFDPTYLSIGSSGAIGVGTSSPSADASFEISSTKPVLIPRIAPVAPATDPANGAVGMVYYNTDTNKFRVYQDTGWADMVAAGGGGGFGLPQYDSGWVSLTTGQTKILTHSLGTEDTLVYCECKASSGDGRGINHRVYGGDTDGHSGYWQEKTTTKITVLRGPSDNALCEKIRVRMWKLS